MRPERWREVERLYQAALERDPAERAALLTNACGADDALRREVESLLDYHPKAKDFIETPAHLAHLPHVADMVRALEPSSVPGRFAGRTLGVYKLKSLIGAGGMGEVYRAVDTRLNRTVAIKTLPERLANDPERRERLEREAKAISSLNHPNICTLYDVGPNYLVMEYIEGAPLNGPMPLGQALKYGIQICDALDAAHRKNIIHRDL